MRFLKFVILSLVILNFSQIIKAQADCGFDFKLFIRDSNGKAIANAKIELNGVDFYYDESREIYSAWTLLGVGSSNDSVLKVQAKGFDKFEKKFELKCGFYAYELRLGAKKVNKATSFDELARINGKVVDQNDGAIANVKVILSDAAGKINETVTNEKGYYHFIVPSGTYSVEFIGPNGFAPKKYADFGLLKGNNKLDVILSVRPCDDCELIVADPIDTNKKP